MNQTISSFLFGGLLFASLGAWAGPAELATPTGRIVCGGTVDKKDILFSQIPTTLVLKGVQDVGPDDETAIIFIDFAKKDQVKVVINWGMSDADYARYEKRKEELSADEFMKWIRPLSSIFWVGFANGIVQLDLIRGEHTISLSCALLAPPQGPVER